MRFIRKPTVCGSSLLKGRKCCFISDPNVVVYQCSDILSDGETISVWNEVLFLMDSCGCSCKQLLYSCYGFIYIYSLLLRKFHRWEKDTHRLWKRTRSVWINCSKLFRDYTCTQHFSTVQSHQPDHPGRRGKRGLKAAAPCLVSEIKGESGRSRRALATHTHTGCRPSTGHSITSPVFFPLVSYVTHYMTTKSRRCEKNLRSVTL